MTMVSSYGILNVDFNTMTNGYFYQTYIIGIVAALGNLRYLDIIMIWMTLPWRLSPDPIGALIFIYMVKTLQRQKYTTYIFC